MKKSSPKQFDPAIVERLSEIVTAKSEHREFTEPNEDDLKALRIGLEIEKLIMKAHFGQQTLQTDESNTNTSQEETQAQTSNIDLAE